MADRVVASLRRAEDDDARLWFECPGCGQYHAPYVEGDPAVHPVWRWNRSVTSPTLVPSVRVTYDGFICHFYVTNGAIQFLSDCTHELAGKTVPMTWWKDQL